MGNLQDIESQKEKFLKNEFFQSSSRAGFSTRGKKIYLDETSEIVRVEIVKLLRNKTFEYFDDFSNQNDAFTEDGHSKRITNIASGVSEQYSEYLEGRRLRIGIVQKVINLFFKYMWCAGYLEKPPAHCPIDSIVKNELIKKSPRLELVNWTELDKIEDYDKYIEVIEDIVKDSTSIAEWELKLWNDRVQPLT